MNIIPAILPKNRDELVEKLQQLRDAGYSGRVQVDLCDGKFVESVTWPFSEFSSQDDFLQNADYFVIDEELFELMRSFSIDYDLMVMDAEHLLTVWDMFHPQNIIIHLNAVTDPEALAIDVSAEHSPFSFIKNKQVMLAISQTTPLDDFEPWYRELGIRQVQIMGIASIGKQGESFSEHTLEIIQEIKKRFPECSIQVDGGVNFQTIHKLATDSDAVVAGSAVFAQGEIAHNLEQLQKCAIL